jgi:hypothetical protein
MIIVHKSDILPGLYGSGLRLEIQLRYDIFRQPLPDSVWQKTFWQAFAVRDKLVLAVKLKPLGSRNLSQTTFLVRGQRLKL